MRRPGIDEYFEFASKLSVHLSYALQKASQKSKAWDQALTLKDAFDTVLYKEGVLSQTVESQHEESLAFKETKADGFVEITKM